MSALISAGAIAQLGERVLCKHEVVGSIPSGSTNRSAEDGGRTTDGLSRGRVSKISDEIDQFEETRVSREGRKARREAWFFDKRRSMRPRRM
jgi:hypothetical protein